MTIDRRAEDLLRTAAPQVLGTLVRRHGRFDLCEDAVQEAVLAAISTWQVKGVPENPGGWLFSVAEHRLIDRFRSDESHRRREERQFDTTGPGPADFDDDLQVQGDDTLALLFMCCHPSLEPPSQLALTLRAVGGLTTAEIARAFLVPEATMAQRITRAKQRIRDAGAHFALPSAAERPDRLSVVLHVLHLIFNEGYTTSSGRDLQRTDLTNEAIRLTRAVHQLLPDEGEVSGLLALMLLTDARRPARSRPDGSLVPLAEQDRALWAKELIDEGVAIITDALSHATLGPYQLQSAIAAVHDEAANVDETDWPQILGLYDLLQRVAPNPMVTLNRAVAVSMVHGPQLALDELDALEADDRMTRHHRLHATRAHLLETMGDIVGARSAYLTAARFASSVPEKRYLDERATRLGAGATPRRAPTEHDG